MKNKLTYIIPIAICTTFAIVAIRFLEKIKKSNAENQKSALIEYKKDLDSINKADSLERVNVDLAWEKSKNDQKTGGHWVKGYRRKNGTWVSGHYRK